MSQLGFNRNSPKSQNPTMKPKLNPKSKSKPPTMGAPSPTTESPSDFCFALARIAVSQICQSVGFKFTQHSALETLTLVATKYLQAIAKSSAAFAAAANRSDSNLFDLSNALSDLRTTHGISGSSTNVHWTDFCLIKSGDLAQIANFVDYAVETPFARPIPRPLDSVKKADDNVRRNPVVPRAAHIPNWLPEVPEITGECGVVSRSGEDLWENCLESGTGTEEMCGVVENGSFERGNLELREKREKVRFKIGVNLKSGVCKRDKGVCWDGHKNRNAYKKDNLSVVGNEVNDNGKKDSLLS